MKKIVMLATVILGLILILGAPLSAVAELAQTATVQSQTPELPIQRFSLERHSSSTFKDANKKNPGFLTLEDAVERSLNLDNTTIHR